MAAAQPRPTLPWMMLSTIMNKTAENKIIEFIRGGASWEQSCLRSQTSWSDFLTAMKRGQDYPQGPHGQFVRDVYTAGRIATERQLWHFRRYSDSDGAPVAATEFHGGHGHA